MDNIKIHDSGFQNRNHKSFLGYLSRKSRINSGKRTESIQTSISTDIISKAAPKYSFRITSYQIGEHVEYAVEMQESFKILGRRIYNNIHFKTRYSMLEKLNQKLQKSSFPAKKFFGNRDKKFVEERRKQLQYFLNEISSQRSLEFLRFVKQIKDADFNKQLNRKFQLN